MALIRCPECKRSISDTAAVCPQCGFQLTTEQVAHAHEQKEQARNGWILGCASVAIIVFFFLLLGSKATSPPETVKNSALDGSVWQVKTWLKENLKDPGSLEFIEWSRVVKSDNGGFAVSVKYRAKNSYGGYVVEHKAFVLNAYGKVIATTDF